MSENIFTELYNRVLSLFGQSAPKEENAKDVACNRLRVVLMQDRTNLTPELLQRMRKELVELLSKYVEMDKEALDLSLEQDGDQVALMLSIPVIRAKDEEEIKEALEKADEAEEPEDSEVVTEEADDADDDVDEDDEEIAEDVNELPEDETEVIEEEKEEKN